YKTMSDQNGDSEVNGTAPDPTITTTDSKSEQPPNVKKAPPVAPKPAWARQSIKSIKSGKPITEALKHPDNRSHDTRRTFGISLRAASTGANLSIRQKISSFETFSSPDGAERPSRRLQEPSPSEEDLSPSSHVPRRSSSSKEGPIEKTEG
uniref:Uncharacterized protein n=1 Tax=Cyprinus carpio TaxID=7962 RepID=A0A8C2FCV8_CYPCA